MAKKSSCFSFADALSRSLASVREKFLEGPDVVRLASSHHRCLAIETLVRPHQVMDTDFNFSLPTVISHHLGEAKSFSCHATVELTS